MSARQSTPKYSRGQVEAAKLLVKREREGKATVRITERVRQMANSDRPSKISS